MMTQDELDLWISELRTPGAKQTKGGLRERTPSGVFRCCLGVYCESVKNYPVAPDGGGFLVPHAGGRVTLRGLAPADDINRARQQVLSSMNDSGKSFAEIADFLEAKGLDWVNGDGPTW